MGNTMRQSPCQDATARHIPKIPGLGFVFRQDFALAHRACDIVAFLERKVSDFVSLWSRNSPDLNTDDYSIWSVGLMHKKVYRSRIANVNELEMRLNDERGRFDQSIVDAAIAASGAVVSELVSVERGTLLAPSIKFQLFCHVSAKSY